MSVEIGENIKKECPIKKIEQMSEEEIMQWMKKELHENFKDIKQDAPIYRINRR